MECQRKVVERLFRVIHNADFVRRRLAVRFGGLGILFDGETNQDVPSGK